MAGYADQLTIKVSAEDAGVKASVNAMRSEIRGLEKELAKSNAEWMKTGRGSEQIKRAEQRIVGLRTEIEKLTGTQRKATAQTKAHGNAFTRMGQQVNKALGGLNNPLLLAGGGIALAMFAKKTITAASDVTESLNKTKVIFGEASQAVIDYADTAADRFGQSKSQALAAAANFASLGKAAGLSGAELSDFALKLSGLAADISSFNNMAPEEAIVALSAALRGEYEPLRRANILLDAASLSQSAYDAGLTKTLQKTLPQNIKVMAAYQEILDQSTDQQGDFNRTQDDYANLSRRVAAEWQNLQAAIGESFMPAAKQALIVLKAIFGIVGGLDPGIRGLIFTFAAVAASLVFAVPKLLAFKTALLETAAAQATAAAGGGTFKQMLSSLVGGINWVTVAIAAAVAALVAYTTAQANAQAGVQALLLTLDENGRVTADTAKRTSDEIAKDIQGYEDWQRVMDATGMSQADLVNALVEGGDAAARVHERLDEASESSHALAWMWSAEARALKGAHNAYENQEEQLYDTAVAFDLAAGAAGDIVDPLNNGADAAARAARNTERLTAAETELADAISAAELVIQRRELRRARKKAIKEFKEKPSEIAGEAMVKANLALAKTYKDPAKQAQFLIDSELELESIVEASTLPGNIKSNIEDPMHMAIVPAKELLGYLNDISNMTGARLRYHLYLYQSGGGGGTPTQPHQPTSSGNSNDMMIPGRADGGPVWGPGTGTSDSIPMNLSNGEFVVRAAAVRALGIDTLASINRADKMVDPSLYTRLASRDAARAPVPQPVAVQAQSGPAIGSVVVNNPAQTVDVERAVLTALRRADRIKRERG